MVSAKLLLQKLQPYGNVNEVVVYDQNLTDIINGILKTHAKYYKEYDKILQYFEDDDIVETAKNVFDFLKQNCKYVIESDQRQTLRSPSAIIATGKTKGCDCKSYSLFFGGILSAYKRKYKTDDDIFYRFAGYNGGDLQHVFVVLKNNDEKFWCDAVLDYFNDRSKQPTIIKDKNMALISMAGIGQNIAQSVQDYTKIGKSRMIFGIGEGETDWGAIAQQVFSFFGKKGNPNDFQGWDGLDARDGNPIGLQAAFWATHDGDSGENEAANILSYIALRPSALFDMITAAEQRLGLNEAQFLAALKNKLDKYSNSPSKGQSINEFIKMIKGNLPGGGSGGPGGGLPPLPDTKEAGISPLIIIGIVLAGAAFFLKKK